MAFKTLDIGRLFVYAARTVERARIVTAAEVLEVEEPFRAATGRVIRLWPFNIGIMVGWWHNEGLVRRDEWAFSDEEKSAVRKHAAAQAVDIDEEFEIIEMLGVIE